MTQLRDPIRQQLAMLDAYALAVLPGQLAQLASFEGSQGKKLRAAQLATAGDVLRQVQRIRALALGELAPEGPPP